LEEAYNDHLAQLPDQYRADHKLKHVVMGIVQMPLKHWEPRGINHLSSKPVPVFDPPFSVKISFLMSHLKVHFLMYSSGTKNYPGKRYTFLFISFFPHFYLPYIHLLRLHGLWHSLTKH